MKVLLINGSPHPNGCTATALKEVVDFTIANMPVVSSQYWNSVHGFTPDDVRKDKEGLQTMRSLGENMAWMLKALEGKPHPEYEPRQHTHFIQDKY